MRPSGYFCKHMYKLMNSVYFIEYIMSLNWSERRGQSLKYEETLWNFFFFSLHSLISNGLAEAFGDLKFTLGIPDLTLEIHFALIKFSVSTQPIIIIKRNIICNNITSSHMRNFLHKCWIVAALDYYCCCKKKKKSP